MSTTLAAWPATAENWLDERGKGAWIAAMVLGFVFFWPAGLALLAYMIWSKRMFSNCCGREGHAMKHNSMHRKGRCGGGHGHGRMRARDMMRPTGNAAFDAYKEETLRRLEEEQESFEAFLERLRAAKDKAEFDQFMEERARAARTAAESESESEDASGESPEAQAPEALPQPPAAGSKRKPGPDIIET